MAVEGVPHGCAHDPAEFLADLKAAGGNWSPMQAARLVMGKTADSLRAEMGESWLLVGMVEQLAAARAAGAWSFAHDTLQAWSDHKAGRLGQEEYRQKLAQFAQEGMAWFYRPRGAG